MFYSYFNRRNLSREFAILLFCSCHGPAYSSELCTKVLGESIKYRLGPMSGFSATLVLRSKGAIQCTELLEGTGDRFVCGGNTVWGDYISTASGHKLQIGLRNYSQWATCDTSNGVSTVTSWAKWEGPVYGTTEYMNFTRSKSFPVIVIPDNF